MKKASEDGFFQCLLETEDYDFIVHTLKEAIGEKPYVEKWWTLLITFLKGRNPIVSLSTFCKSASECVLFQAMLEVYSHYVRLFMDDQEMLEKYRKETEDCGFPEIEGWWKNPFSFEKFKSHPEKASENRPKKVVVNRPFLKSSIQDSRPQGFPFRESLMAYILKAAKPALLQKLYQTCKYFFALSRIPVCHRLVLGFFHADGPHGPKIEFIDFDREALHISKERPDKFLPCKLHLSNSIEVPFLPDPSQLSKFVPLISECHIRFLEVSGQSFTFKEYCFLVNSGIVKVLKFNNINIRKENKEFAYLEDVINKVPKIERFQ